MVAGQEDHDGDDLPRLGIWRSAALVQRKVSLSVPSSTRSHASSVISSTELVPSSAAHLFGQPSEHVARIAAALIDR